MQRRMIARIAAIGLIAGVVGSMASRAGEWPEWPLRIKAAPGVPNSLEQVARSIDSIEDKILDEGTVVIKQPDVYSQSRMTLYRKNFESQLFGAINNFNAVLSARVFRSDQAAFLSQSNLAAAASTANRRGSTSTTTNTVAPPTLIPAGSGPGITPNGLATGSISRPDTNSPAFGNVPFTGGFAGGSTPYGLGVEPTVYLDELKRYQDHLNQLRRINMGDDIADSAGYGLYLIRMPISIQPGEGTRQGHGAVLTATVRHDFDKDFLPTTFRNLVINDLVDQLSPVVFELIRSNALDLLPENVKTALDAEKAYARQRSLNEQMYAVFLNASDFSRPPASGERFEAAIPPR